MEQIKQEAEEIRDETVANQNTATRVGGWMVRMLNRLPEIFQKKIGKTHQVEVETIDYGATPQSSMTFDGEKFKLKLQIPRGKDGESPTVNDDGDLELPDETVVQVVTNYEIEVSPQRPRLDHNGKSLEGPYLTVNCYRRNMFGVRIPVTDDASMKLQAMYKVLHDSGLEDTAGQEIISPIAKDMVIPVQKRSGNLFSTRLYLDLCPTDPDKSEVYARKEVEYSRQGAPGEDGDDGQPGGTFVPVITDNGLLDFHFEQIDGSDVPITRAVQVVPTINEEGKWVIGGKSTEYLADVTPAFEKAATAANEAKLAKEAAQQSAGSASTASGAATTAANEAKLAKEAATRSESAASSASGAATSAATSAASAKKLQASVITKNTGVCRVEPINNEEYIVMNVSTSMGITSFCFDNELTQTDRICYVLVRNVDTSNDITVTLSTARVMAPANSFQLPKGMAREVSYIKHSVANITIVTWGALLRTI